MYTTARTSEQQKKYNRTLYAKLCKEKPEYFLLERARKNAKLKNMDFNLTLEDVKIPEVCPVLDIEIHSRNGNRLRTPNSPSLDRFDNAKGYVRDNVQVVSWRANELKRNGTLDEFKSIVKWMEVKT